MGGKVLVPTAQFIRKLIAARLAADVLDVPTVLVARTDADGADLLTSDIDARDRPFLTGERTAEGLLSRSPAGIDQAIARGARLRSLRRHGLVRDLDARPGRGPQFAEAIHDRFPGKLLAYNCSPSFNWKAKLDDATIAGFQRELAAMGYKFQFVTLAGFHALNLACSSWPAPTATRHGRLRPAPGSRVRREAEDGYHAVKHQRSSAPATSTRSPSASPAASPRPPRWTGSTEDEQFATHAVPRNGR